MLGFCPLASGSKGNCLYLGTAQTKILIDLGLSTKAVTERLSQLQVQPHEIDAIVITHEHIDHIRGLDVWSSKWSTPILTNGDTAKALLAQAKSKLHLKIFSTGESFTLQDLEIHPFSIQHDAADPVAFVFRTGNLKIGVCADLGLATSLVINQLKGCDYLYIEANHEPSMVHASSRPSVYKQRVLGRQGHLSNEACAKLLGEIIHPGLKHIYLAHLSSECNSPDLALKIIQEKLASCQVEATVSIAWQDRLSAEVRFEMADARSESFFPNLENPSA